MSMASRDLAEILKTSGLRKMQVLNRLEDDTQHPFVGDRGFDERDDVVFALDHQAFGVALRDRGRPGREEFNAVEGADGPCFADHLARANDVG